MTDTMTSARTAPDVPVKSFKDQREWGSWLRKNHAASCGVWLKLAKKGSAFSSVSYGEALEVALCYGWIDGQKRSFDTQTWLQKFTPRGERSIWSSINREKARALVAAGKMKPAGLRAVERAKQNGQWDSAYDSFRSARMPDDFRKELERSTRAKQFFATLDRTNRYSILWRIQTAKKAETRAMRIQKFIRMLERGEKVHP